MKLQICFVFSALLFAASATAQTYKCKDANGKTIYSDASCEYGAATIKAQDNTITRTEAERFRDQAYMDQKNRKPLDENLDSKSAIACRFSYYAYSDEKGKQLAADAKEECLQNYELKKQGKSSQASFIAYGMWKDHKELSKRTIQTKKTSTCSVNVLGGLDCREK